MSRREVNGIELWVEEGGAGEPVLLLCHGLAGTGEVWAGMRELVEAHWPGRYVIPDMRGHGRSGHAALYGVAQHAADMAALVAGAERVVVAGHSMGGQAAMVLASGWFGIDVSDVIAIGVKAGWTDAEMAGARRIAEAPVRWFESRDAATERFLKISGLIGIVPPDSPLAASGIVEADGKFRLAADMRTNLVAGAATRATYELAACHSNVVLAAGSGDRMSTVAELRAMDPAAVALTGLGHNAHVEDPAAVWNLIAGACGLTGEPK